MQTFCGVLIITQVVLAMAWRRYAKVKLAGATPARRMAAVSARMRFLCASGMVLLSIGLLAVIVTVKQDHLRSRLASTIMVISAVDFLLAAVSSEFVRSLFLTGDGERKSRARFLIPFIQLCCASIALSLGGLAFIIFSLTVR